MNVCFHCGDDCTTTVIEHQNKQFCCNGCKTVFDVLNENDLIAEETLFVDDLKENTDSADTLGIKTWNLTPKKEDVTELFIKNKFL